MYKSVPHVRIQHALRTNLSVTFESRTCIQAHPQQQARQAPWHAGLAHWPCNSRQGRLPGTLDWPIGPVRLHWALASLALPWPRQGRLDLPARQVQPEPDWALASLALPWPRQGRLDLPARQVWLDLPWHAGLAHACWGPQGYCDLGKSHPLRKLLVDVCMYVCMYVCIYIIYIYMYIYTHIFVSFFSCS